MFNWLVDWWLDRLVARELAALPRIGWRSMLDEIGGAIEGGTVYLETRDRRFVALGQTGVNYEELDVVSLNVAWLQEGVPPWETEAPAWEAARALMERFPHLRALVLLSRDLETFVGYYVQLRPGEGTRVEGGSGGRQSGSCD